MAFSNADKNVCVNPENSHIFYNNWRSPPKMAQRGEGVYLYDENGKRYMDAIGGMFVVTVGHGVNEIADAIAEQARTLCFANRAQFTNEPQERLADMVIDMAPEGMDRVYFVTSGSTANEIAIQITREYHIERGNTGKYKIISLWHNYHGMSIGTLSLSGNLATQRFMNMEPYLLNFPRIQPPYCYQCPFKLKYPGCGLACVDDLERTIEQEGPDSIAAFLVTPIIAGTAGAIVPPPDYFPRIREICDRYDILLIDDEVVTGFGRLGKNFGIDLWNITPDLITAAKTMASGYAPLGAVIAHKKIWKTFTEGGRSRLILLLTHAGHPISCAAGLAVQKYIKEHDLVERCAQTGAYLKSKLLALAEREPIVGDVRGEGLFLGVEFVQDRETHAPFPRSMQLMEKVVQAASAQGLIISGRFGIGTKMDGDHLSIAPPFIISESECDELVAMLESSIRQAKQKLNLA